MMAKASGKDNQSEHFRDIGAKIATEEHCFVEASGCPLRSR